MNDKNGKSDEILLNDLAAEAMYMYGLPPDLDDEGKGGEEAKLRWLVGAPPEERWRWKRVATSLYNMTIDRLVPMDSLEDGEKKKEDKKEPRSIETCEIACNNDAMLTWCSLAEDAPHGMELKRGSIERFDEWSVIIRARYEDIPGVIDEEES